MATDLRQPDFFEFPCRTPELAGLMRTIRKNWDQEKDLEVMLGDDLTQWCLEDTARLPPLERPDFLTRIGSKERRRYWQKRMPLGGWLYLRLLAPREGKPALVVIGFDQGYLEADDGRKAADALEEALRGNFGPSIGIIRINLQEDPDTAYQADGPFPAFSSLLRYHNEEDQEKAKRFWTCQAGAGANMLWYPSAGSDTRPLAWFLPLQPDRPSVDIDYFVLSGLGEPLYESLVRSTLRHTVANKTIFRDRVSRLSIVDSIPFYLDEERVLWFVGRSYGFRDGYMRPIVRGVNGLLLRTRFESTRLGSVEQNLVYLEMENSNVELEIVREGFLNPVVFCGVRDGCGFGGNGRCENDLGHIGRLINTRTFTPAIWVTDHLRYRNEEGIRHAWWFRPDDADGALLWDSFMTPEIFLEKRVSRYGVEFLFINSGRIKSIPDPESMEESGNLEALTPPDVPDGLIDEPGLPETENSNKAP